MKKLLLIMLMAMPLNSFASGKLQMMGNYFRDSKNLKPTVGLAIYEKLGMGLAYNSWTGLGEGSAEDNGRMWATTKHSLEFDVMQKLKLGMGVQLDYSKKQIQDSLFMKVEYRLWD